MSEGHRITQDEAERLYNQHVEDANGYPWLTQADFYGDPPVDEFDLALDLDAPDLTDEDFGFTAEAQDNNGW